MRCFEAEAFSRTVVETVHSKFDVAQRDGFEGHFIWESKSRYPGADFSRISARAVMTNVRLFRATLVLQPNHLIPLPNSATVPEFLLRSAASAGRLPVNVG